MSGFRPIPAGWFVMGSAAGQRDEAPVHRVWVDAFELAVDPVTRADYARFREATRPGGAARVGQSAFRRSRAAGS